jgi:hypothetical protein
MAGGATGRTFKLSDNRGVGTALPALVARQLRDPEDNQLESITRTLSSAGLVPPVLGASPEWLLQELADAAPVAPAALNTDPAVAGSVGELVARLHGVLQGSAAGAFPERTDDLGYWLEKALTAMPDPPGAELLQEERRLSLLAGAAGP